MLRLQKIMLFVIIFASINVNPIQGAWAQSVINKNDKKSTAPGEDIKSTKKFQDCVKGLSFSGGEVSEFAVSICSEENNIDNNENLLTRQPPADSKSIFDFFYKKDEGWT